MDFRADTRGVSAVIGFLLIFSLLIIAFSSYQAFYIPNQNEGVEYNHNQEVQNDMLEVRNAILEAKISGENKFAEVQLGTQFPSRLFGMNPPHPSGTLQTTDAGAITVTEDGGAGDELDLKGGVDNKFVEYKPTYSEYQNAGTLRYENTVLYHDLPSANLPRSGQQLLQDDQVNLIPVQQNFSRNGIGTVSVEPIPGLLQTETLDDPVIEVPTRLSEDDWEELLEEQIRTTNLQEEDITVDNDILTLTLNGEYEIEYAPIGFNRAPEGGKRGSGETEINPASPGDISLVGANWAKSSVTLTFQNSANTNNSFAEGRVNFYLADRGSKPQMVEEVNAVDRGDNPRGENWQILQAYEDLDPEILLPGNSRTEIELVFDVDPNVNQDWFIVSFRLETGEQGLYFVGDNFDSGFLQPEITSTNAPVTEGETLSVDVDVENTGSGEGTSTVELYYDSTGDGTPDALADSQDVENLAEGGTESITLDWATQTGDAGEDIPIEVIADGSDTTTVTVLEDETTVTPTPSPTPTPTPSPTPTPTPTPQPDPASFQINDVRITDANGVETTEFAPGDEVRFEVDVENTGDLEDTQDIDVTELIDSWDDTNFAGEVDPEAVTLAGGGTDTVTLIWNDAENTHPQNNQDIDYEVTIESNDDSFNDPNAFTVTG